MLLCMLSLPSAAMSTPSTYGTGEHRDQVPRWRGLQAPKCTTPAPRLWEPAPLGCWPACPSLTGDLGRTGCRTRPRPSKLPTMRRSRRTAAGPGIPHCSSLRTLGWSASPQTSPQAKHPIQRQSVTLSSRGGSLGRSSMNRYCSTASPRSSESAAWSSSPPPSASSRIKSSAMLCGTTSPADDSSASSGAAPPACHAAHPARAASGAWRAPATWRTSFRVCTYHAWSGANRSARSHSRATASARAASSPSESRR